MFQPFTRKSLILRMHRACREPCAHLRGQAGQHEALGELLDGQNVHEQRAAPQALHGQGGQHGPQRQDGAREDDDLGVLLAEVVRVAKVAHAHGRRGLPVVRPGRRQHLFWRSARGASGLPGRDTARTMPGSLLETGVSPNAAWAA